jgi:hypothetical protein
LNPEGNYIAHALIRDRKLDDGVETLHVDELQSDLHQKGSRDGYDTPIARTEAAKFRKDVQPKVSKAFKELADKLLPRIEKAMKGETVVGSGLYRFDINELKKHVAKLALNYEKNPDLMNLITQARSQLRNAFTTLEEYNYIKGKSKTDTDAFTKFEKIYDPIETKDVKIQDLVPNYPFKDDWYVMSLKQLIKDAIDEGKDAISVSGSAPIKARYTDQYSKFYESLYDQKIPSAMKKLANKYGGKFERGGLDLEDTFGPRGVVENIPSYEADEIVKAEANIIRITPEMRAKIAEEGLSSFAFGGAVQKKGIENLPIMPRRPGIVRGIGSI